MQRATSRTASRVPKTNTMDSRSKGGIPRWPAWVVALALLLVYGPAAVQALTKKPQGKPATSGTSQEASSGDGRANSPDLQNSGDVSGDRSSGHRNQVISIPASAERSATAPPVMQADASHGGKVFQGNEMSFHYQFVRRELEKLLDPLKQEAERSRDSAEANKFLDEDGKSHVERGKEEFQLALDSVVAIATAVGSNNEQGAVEAQIEAMNHFRTADAAFRQALGHVRPELLLGGKITILTGPDDRECGVVVSRMSHAAENFVLLEAGGDNKWGRGHQFSQSLPALNRKLGDSQPEITLDLEERPGQVDISWNAEVQIEYETSYGRTLTWKGNYFFETDEPGKGHYVVPRQ